MSTKLSTEGGKDLILKCSTRLGRDVQKVAHALKEGKRGKRYDPDYRAH